MRFHLFICVLFLLQLSIESVEKGNLLDQKEHRFLGKFFSGMLAPIKDFIAKYETQINDGKQIIKISGPYVKGFVNLGRFVKVSILSVHLRDKL